MLAAHPNMGAGEGVQRSRVRRPMETTPPEPYYPSGASCTKSVRSWVRLTRDWNSAADVSRADGLTPAASSTFLLVPLDGSRPLTERAGVVPRTVCES